MQGTISAESTTSAISAKGTVNTGKCTECTADLVFLRKKILDSYRQKQPFRVAAGKGKWFSYEKFDSRYNLREVLNDEIVIEFDSGLFEEKKSKDWNNLSKEEQQEFKDKISWPGINFTAINLYKANITFSVWDHKGKSPHLHVHNLPIDHLEPDKRRLFKKIFIRKYVPLEYLKYADISLTGIHLIAIEWVYHWKNKYGVKRLLNKFGLNQFNPINFKRVKQHQKPII